jgi:hypothetical protein
MQEKLTPKKNSSRNTLSNPTDTSQLRLEMDENHDSPTPRFSVAMVIKPNRAASPANNDKCIHQGVFANSPDGILQRE